MAYHNVRLALTLPCRWQAEGQVSPPRGSADSHQLGSASRSWAGGRVSRGRWV